MSESTFICPKGHDSTEPDYCSECGAKIDAALAAAADAAAICPDCGTSRVGGARYCEVCRFDFEPQTAAPEPAAEPEPEPVPEPAWEPEPPPPPPRAAPVSAPPPPRMVSAPPPPPPRTASPPPPPPRIAAVSPPPPPPPLAEPEEPEDLPPLWPLPLALRPPIGTSSSRQTMATSRSARVTAPTSPSPRAAAPAAAAPAVAAPAQPAPIPSELQRLWVAVRVDPSLVNNPDPDNPCPVDTAERMFPLDLAEMLVGRRSQAKDVNPEIPVADSGTSRRHLTFLRRADGGFSVLDLNSTNGTKLNGIKLEAGLETPIKAGDELVIGEWTRLIIRKR